MSKFYQYINEQQRHYPTDEDLENAWKTLSKDCSEIINFYKKSDIVNDFNGLFRGSLKNAGVISNKIKPRKDRRPTDTPQDIQIELDKAFKSEFGWKPRSQGVFSFGRARDAAFYGYPYAVFPSNGYKFLWSPNVPDLYVYLKSANVLSDFPGIEQKIKEIIDTYTNKNLDKAIDSGHEIMIGCKYYYLVSKYTWDMILLDYIKR